MSLFPLLYPVTQSKKVTSTWGKPRTQRNGVHEGTDHVDVKGSPAYAAADGVVIRANRKSSGFAGRLIAIKHDSGVISRYLHMTDIFVNVGDYVIRGQQIGTVGITGTVSSRPHVHFDVKLNPKYLPIWVGEFGTPTKGFGRNMKGFGIGVPAEPILVGVSYGAKTKAFTKNMKVPFAVDLNPIDVITAGLVVFGMYKFLTS